MTETYIIHYTLERSEEGQLFRMIEQFNPIKNDGGRSDYEYVDRTRVNGNSFYRVRVTEENGNVSYSPIVRIFSHAVQGLHIFPNPVLSSVIQWQAVGLVAGKYEVGIYNSKGELVKVSAMISDGSLISQPLSLYGLTPGIYILQISGPVKLKKKFVVQ